MFTNIYIKCLIEGDSRWSRTFYRFIDTAEGEEGDRVREIERDLFHKVKFVLVTLNIYLWFHSQLSLH